MDTSCGAVINTQFLDCGHSNIHNLDGIQYFDNLLELECFFNPLYNLPPLPNSLITLRCFSDSLNSLPPLPNSLKILSCWSNNLTGFPSLPDSLSVLACDSNQFSNLPSLPSALTALGCTHNQLVSLPALPNSLLELSCSYNQLAILPNLPNSITELGCVNNNLTSLPALASTQLTTLHCGNNLITVLPVLPSTLIELYCDNNQISSITQLPTSLERLFCMANSIVVISQLPSSLTQFHCYINQLTSLPVLPPSLVSLNCWANQLFTLPNLPNSLTSLNCEGNFLTSLPPLPNLLNYLDCSNNLLTSIPDLPDSFGDLHINNNTNLSCFPKFKNISHLWWGFTAINCLPSAGNITTASPSINNLSLCQPASGCNFEWNIFGRVYNDTNSNCFRDSSELLFKNIPVELDSGGNQLQIFITNNEGYYSFETGLGNYQIRIDTTGLPFDVTCPAGGNYLSSLTSTDSLDADLDFGLQCKAGYLDLIAKSISPSASLRPGAQRTLYLDAGDATLFYGVTCATGVSGSVEAILNGPVSYISPAAGALTPTSINGDTISWSVNDFSLVNPAADFNIIVQVDSSATINDTVCVQLNIYPAADNIPSNNSVSNCFPIVNSFDPNAKEIYPAGFVDTTQHEFTFTIFFQNTGNAVAENIYILDTLDDDLKLNSFQFLSSSHDVITQMLPGRVVRFSFPHINLPDSVSNEPASHGYVQFKVSRKNILYPDMIILNNAHIFFDLNPGVTTNDAYAILNFNCNDLLSLIIPDTAICENEILTASNNINFPFPVNYEWLIDTTSVSASSSVSVTGLSSGVHQLTLNVSAGYCTVSYVQQIVVHALPSIPVINISADTLSTGPGFSYQWFLNNDSILGAVQNNYVISQSGWYSVVITDSNGCSALSDSVFVSPVGIEEISDTRFNIFPNPVKDVLYIQIISKAGEFLNIELNDITGRNLKTIFKGNSPYAFSKFNLPVKTFSKGVFILKVNNSVRKIVIE